MTANSTYFFINGEYNDPKNIKIFLLFCIENKTISFLNFASKNNVNWLHWSNIKKSPKTFIKKKTCEIKSPLSSAISNT